MLCPAKQLTVHLDAELERFYAASRDYVNQSVVLQSTSPVNKFRLCLCGFSGQCVLVCFSFHSPFPSSLHGNCYYYYYYYFFSGVGKTTLAHSLDRGPVKSLFTNLFKQDRDDDTNTSQRTRGVEVRSITIPGFANTEFSLWDFAGHKKVSEREYVCVK